MMMMAGYARDPQHAQQLIDELHAEHGRSFWQNVKLILLRPFDKSFWRRLLILFRRANGESDNEIPRFRHHREEPIAYYRFRIDK